MKQETRGVSFTHQHVKRPVSVPRKSAPVTCAEVLLKEIASRENFKTPAEIFFQEPKKRDSLLAAFCDRALEDFGAGQIARTIRKWNYPFKILTHHDVSKDQAAGAYMFACTSKVDWAEVFFGGERIVERNTLLNGVFGRAGTNHMNATDVKAAALYLSQHDMENDLPQAPFMAFLGRCGGGRTLEDERNQVTRERSNFIRELGHLVVDGLFFKIADNKHDTTLKFRLLCAVFDSDYGKLVVVSDRTKESTSFTSWVSGNINHLISASDDDLKKIKDFAEREGGLLDKLRKPGSGAVNYNPWSDLLAEIRSADGVTGKISGKEGEIYRQAVKIWRYAILQINVEKVSSYENRWAVRKKVEDMLNADLSLVCDDGRQQGNFKALGGMLTKEEFVKMFVKSNAQMEILRDIPHYGCGFLTATQNIHFAIDYLYAKIAEEHEKNKDGDRKQADYELGRKINFFEGRIQRILLGKRNVSEDLTLRDYLPAPLHTAVDRLIKNEPLPEDAPETKVAKTLYSLFAGGRAEDEKLRNVTKRAVETGVFEIDGGTGSLHMPAATKTIGRLQKFFGDGYKEEFTAAQINALITEEAARNAYGRYAQWAKETNAKFELVFVMEGFGTGQYIEVPPEPASKAEYLNLARKDHYLNHEFTQDEINALGLKKYLEWTIAA